MAVKIYKYPVTIDDTFSLTMPHGSVIISVQMQGVDAQMWAMVDTALPMVDRKFVVLETGTIIERKNSLLFIATIQERGFVWHVFEQI